METLASEDFESFLLFASISLLAERYDVNEITPPNPEKAPDADERIIQTEDIAALTTLSILLRHYFDDDNMFPEKVNEFYGKIFALLEKLEEIRKVQGIPIFPSVVHILEKRIHVVDVTSKFLPRVDCCLNCMPWDGGEPVELSASRGSLEELTLENLYDSFSDIEWCDFTLRNVSAHCHGCGSELGEFDDVYEDWHEEPEAQEED